MSAQVRQLLPADLPQALHLSNTANWNQTPQDWARLLQLAACFCIELDGRVVSSATAIVYGNRELAWIGMVLTLPEYRGRGLASQLVRAALDHCSDVPCIKLDATEAGAPVYRKFGFEDECVVERWVRPADAPAASGQAPANGQPDLELDLRAFGTDRAALLNSFEDPFLCTGDAFATIRPGRQAAQFGPCVSASMESASLLASAAIAGHHTPVFWDLFKTHANARQIAHSLRFAPARRLLRMTYQGRDVQQDPSLVYAMAGFELG